MFGQTVLPTSLLMSSAYYFGKRPLEDGITSPERWRGLIAPLALRVGAEIGTAPRTVTDGTRLAQILIASAFSPLRPAPFLSVRDARAAFSGLWACRHSPM